MTIREVPSDQRRAARDQVEAWGFYRPISYEEEAYAYWVRSELGFMWFVRGPREPDHLMVHVCVSPEHRNGPGRDPQSFLIIRVIAGLLGATRVYAPLGQKYPGWARWLARMGFDKSDDWGPYFELEDPWEKS